MTQENALKIFKCLSDTSRLRIVQSLAQGEMYTELLAERLNLTPSTVSFHMKKLEDAGLAVSRKEQYYTVYSLEEYRRKVIRAFFEYGKLRSIPVQRKKKLICYEQIAARFEIGKVYEEQEVNEIISPIHEDYCTIRRDMISEGIFRRDGSRYTRLK